MSEGAVRRGKGTRARRRNLLIWDTKNPEEGESGGVARVARRDEGGACSRTCIPQSGIPLLLCRIHIYAASLGDNSAIMRRARARARARAHLSRRAAFIPLIPSYFDSFSFPYFFPSFILLHSFVSVFV